MAELLDLPSWKLDTGDLIQQLAMLAWLNKGDEGKDLYKTITGARVAYEIYNRMSGQRTIDEYQTQCIMGIVEYIQKHPKASETELAEEVNKHVQLFQAKVALS